MLVTELHLGLLRPDGGRNKYGAAFERGIGTPNLDRLIPAQRQALLFNEPPGSHVYGQGLAFIGLDAQALALQAQRGLIKCVYAFHGAGYRRDVLRVKMLGQWIFHWLLLRHRLPHWLRHSLLARL